jgi:hypothetical protein
VIKRKGPAPKNRVKARTMPFGSIYEDKVIKFCEVRKIEKSFGKTHGTSAQQGYGYKNSHGFASATGSPAGLGESGEKNRPVKRFRAHDVEISVWENTCFFDILSHNPGLNKTASVKAGDLLASRSLRGLPC